MRGKSCRSWSGDGGTGAPSGAAGPAGRAAAAAATTSPGEGCSGGRDAANLRASDSGPTPHNGGRGRAGGPLPLGPGDLGAAPERRMSLGSRAPAPCGVGEAGLGLGWARRANAHWFSRVAGPVYTRARARCAALLVRVAADVRVPGSDISAPGAAALGQERLSVARARPRPPASGRAPCCWVALPPPRGRAGHLCCVERRRAGGRLAV